MNEEEILRLSGERQKYQMHKKGYEGIVEAIKGVPKANIGTVNIDIEMSETNKILSELIKKMNEPLCVTLKFD